MRSSFPRTSVNIRSRFIVRTGVGCFCVWLACLAGSEAVAANSPVIIDVRAVTYVEPDTFPVGRPPSFSIVPELVGGTCIANWSCNVFIDTRRPRFGFKTVTAEITQLRVVTNLGIKIWQVEGAGADVLPHEKTHQAIEEHYYALTRETIERLAAAVIGRRLTISRKNAEKELEQILETMADDFRQEVRRQTKDRCEFAQDRFDTINQHGQIAIENSVAMAQAIAEEKAHWETIKEGKQLIK